MKIKLLSIFAAAMLLAGTSAHADQMDNVLNDTIAGAGVGALIGAGAMLLSDTPSSNSDYILTGAGYGIILGAVFGVANETTAAVSINDGETKLNFPKPEVAIINNEVGFKTNLIAGTF